MNRISPFVCLSVLLILAESHAAHAQDTFIESDDYTDGNEIVNVFLKEADYRLMVEDIERNAEAFDWGWVKTAAAPEAAPEQQKTGKLGRLLRLPRRGPNPAEPGALGFDLHTYKIVSVSVQNFAGVVQPSTITAVREAFALAAGEMGLMVAPEGAQADLELGVAIVDLKRDTTYVYFANVDPFIELEVRLRDGRAGENLVLLRNQSHSTTPEDAALNYANALVKFLR